MSNPEFSHVPIEEQQMHTDSQKEESSNAEVLNNPDFKALFDQLENEELKQVFLTMTPDQASTFFNSTMNWEDVYVQTIIKHQDEEMIQKVSEYIATLPADRKTAEKNFRDYLIALDQE